MGVYTATCTSGKAPSVLKGVLILFVGDVFCRLQSWFLSVCKLVSSSVDFLFKFILAIQFLVILL